MVRPYLADVDTNEAQELLDNPEKADASVVQLLAQTIQGQAVLIEELKQELEDAKSKLMEANDAIGFLQIREPTQSEANDEAFRAQHGRSMYQKPWLRPGEVWLRGDWQGHRCDQCQCWIFRTSDQTCSSCATSFDLAEKSALIDQLTRTLIQILEESPDVEKTWHYVEDYMGLNWLAKTVSHVARLERKTHERS